MDYFVPDAPLNKIRKRIFTRSVDLAAKQNIF